MKINTKYIKLLAYALIFSFSVYVLAHTINNTDKLAIKLGETDSTYHLYTSKEIKEDSSKDNAIMSFYSANNNNKEFVIIIPGGAYQSISAGEMEPVARIFTSKGINAFTLKYRVGDELKNANVFDDLARALTIIKQNQDLFNVDINNYMIIGFSAGGHMAAIWASTSPDGYLAYHLPRPKYVILGYPALSYGEDKAELLLAPGYTDKQVKGLSVYNYVDDTYPMTYIVHSTNDDVIPISNADNFDIKLSYYGVKHQYIRYTKSGHGFGTGSTDETKDWIIHAIDYYEDNK
jgi:acetyl esterase/lipase